MALLRHDSNNLFNAFRSDLDTLFDGFLNDFHSPSVAVSRYHRPSSVSSRIGTGAMRRMPVDVVEKEDRLEVRADLPGVPKESIDIEIDDDRNLVIKTSQKSEMEVEKKEENFFYQERSNEAMRRVIGLPSTIDEEGIKAESRDGVLYITLPKRAKEAGRKITIA